MEEAEEEMTGRAEETLADSKTSQGNVGNKPPNSSKERVGQYGPGPHLKSNIQKIGPTMGSA